MTEQELRQNAVAVMRGWLGAKKGDATHKGIINLYNSHTPLPRGARMSYTMAWCAATVSAAAVAVGITDIMPRECSCGEMVKLYQALGRWVEDDNYTPSPGDLVMYNWADDGKGDCTGAPNHVGMVETVADGTFTVIEGNMGTESCVGRRTMKIGGQYIRGFCCPDFASKATSPWYTQHWARATELGLVDGTRPEDPITRAEVAVIVLRALDTQKGVE